MKNQYYKALSSLEWARKFKLPLSNKGNYNPTPKAVFLLKVNLNHLKSFREPGRQSHYLKSLTLVKRKNSTVS